MEDGTMAPSPRGRHGGGGWTMTSMRALVVEDFSPSPADLAAFREAAAAEKARRRDLRTADTTKQKKNNKRTTPHHHHHHEDDDEDEEEEGLLTLRTGQTVTVVAQSENGWWAGALEARLGHFPARCVRLVQTSRGGSSSSSSSSSAVESLLRSSGGVSTRPLPPVPLSDSGKVPVPARPSPRAASACQPAGSAPPPTRPQPRPPSTAPTPSAAFNPSASGSAPTRPLPQAPRSQSPSGSPRSLEPQSALTDVQLDRSGGSFPTTTSPLGLPNPVSAPVKAPSPATSPRGPPPVSVPPKEEPAPAVDTTQMDKDSRMRREVINEIIRTERDYISDLEVVINLFMTPLRMSNILSDGDINTIFSNVQLLLGVNREFYENLSKKVSEHAEVSANMPIGDVFARLADYFKMYTIYCSNHPTAVDTKIKLAKKNSSFRKFLALAESDDTCRGLNLNDYLIKPVQRICKYPLLLRELVKFTPQTHEDYAQLTLAERKIGEVVMYINQGAKQAAARDQVVKIHSYFESIELLSPTRKLVREGQMTFIKGKEKQSVWVWLFNDLILVGKPKQTKYLEESKRKGHCFTIVARIGLGDVRLVNLSTVEGVEAFEVQEVEKDGMKVTKVKESYVLGLPTMEQKTEWMFGLKNIIKHFQQMEFVAEKKKAETEAKESASKPSSDADKRGLSREMSDNSPTIVMHLVKQTTTSAEEEGKLATIDVYLGGIGLISTGRRLVRDSQMAWLSGKNKDKVVEVWVWLFNDLFVIGKPKKQKHLQESHRKANCFSTVARIGLDELRLINLTTMQGYEAFEIENVEKDGMSVVKVKDSFTLGLKSTESKMEWVLSTNKLVKEFLQRDMLEEKRRRESQGESSLHSSASRVASPRSLSNSSSGSPRSSSRRSRAGTESQPSIEDAEVAEIDSLFGGVALVSPGRQLIREGPLTWLNSKNKDKVWMWLLTDVLLIGKPKKPKYIRKDKRKPSCFHLVANIALDEMKLINLGTVDGLEAFEIHDVEKEGVVVVRVREQFRLGAIAADTRDWVTAIKQALKHYQMQELSAEKARLELEKEGVDAEIERRKGGSFIIRQRSRKDSIQNIIGEEKKNRFGFNRSMSSPRLVAPPVPSPRGVPPSPASALGLRSGISRSVNDIAAVVDLEDSDPEDVHSNGIDEAPMSPRDEDTPLPPIPVTVPPRPLSTAHASALQISGEIATPAKKLATPFVI